MIHFWYAAGMTRLDENAVLLNVTIPVQPISYDEAHELMLHMKGTLNNNFLGGFGKNITYKIGPGYEKPRENW